MLEFYRNLAEGYGRLSFAAKAGLFVGIALVTTVLAMVVIVRLPVDHFSRAAGPRPAWRSHPVIHWTLLIIKNVLGAVILPLGIVMALPLVPGPGLVFILIGLSLLDFPGKRALERRLLARPAVLNYMNQVREQFGKPPLVVGEE